MNVSSTQNQNYTPAVVGAAGAAAVGIAGYAGGKAIANNALVKGAATTIGALAGGKVTSVSPKMAGFITATAAHSGSLGEAGSKLPGLAAHAAIRGTSILQGTGGEVSDLVSKAAAGHPAIEKAVNIAAKEVVSGGAATYIGTKAPGIVSKGLPVMLALAGAAGGYALLHGIAVSVGDN